MILGILSLALVQSPMSNDEPLSRLRALCLAFPEAREVEAWGAPTFRVKTMFATYSAPDGGAYGERASAWIKALPANQSLMIGAAPDRFFVPPYVGGKGWIGVYLDSADTDWEELRLLLWDAWRMSVPKTLAARYGDLPPTTEFAPE